MKLNYTFPYNFIDKRDQNVTIVNAELIDSDIIITIDLRDIHFSEKIDILLELENTQTFFRKHYIISKSNSTVIFPYCLIGSKIDYSILLVVKEEGYLELDGCLDFYEYGDCIGILEKNTIIFEEEEDLSGLIKISPSENDKISYDLTSDWITIELPKETYEKFYPWQQDEKSIPFALASLGMSCIQFAITKTLLDDSKNQDRKWLESICKLLEENGYDIKELEIDDIPGVTNKILGNCIQRMVNATDIRVDHEDFSILS